MMEKCANYDCGEGFRWSQVPLMLIPRQESLKERVGVGSSDGVKKATGDDRMKGGRNGSRSNSGS